MKKGQASIELVLISSLVIILGILVLSKYLAVQESVLIVADARKETIKTIEELDTKYVLKGNIEYSEPEKGKATLKLFIDPIPAGADLETFCKIRNKLQYSKLITMEIQNSATACT